MLENLHRTESNQRIALLFGMGFFTNGHFDEVSVEKAETFCIFLYLFLFCSVALCRKELLL